ncbi:MAG: prepilin-type N-terminal cleavage/methylation domain-containing protein [Elusimicrobiaceae bacterium]|nr:prepilin-type N-terminal cleavage/methylation domain-containing protein [Elusimicrobiaceae bacterium]
MNRKGFTLIELLVVVLIIGILTAIAIPQYEKSIARSRAAEAMLTAKTIIDAASIYAATYRACPTTVNDLDVKVNANGKNWNFGLDDLGSRNCGVSVKPRTGTSYTAQLVFVKDANGSGIPSGLTSGEMYWTCIDGDCTDFFFDVGVKKPSASATYYQ